ncbi:MAG: transcription antitermination factor NusB [Pseudomonadales bacterium]
MSKATARPISQTRHKARHFAMQAVYSWDMAGGTAESIESEFRTDYDMNKADLDYFRALLSGVIGQYEQLDAMYEPCLQDRSVAELDKVEKAVLRVATYELSERPDTPYKVIINEAVSLTKKFGATDGFKFVNGVLDQTARQLRGPEVAAG